MISLFTVYAKSFDEIVFDINRTVINPLIQFAFVAAFVIFLWGLIEFLYNLNNADKRKEGQKHMIWGVIGLTIMVGVFGIINLLINTFGLGAARINNDTQQFTPPKIREIKIGQ